MLRTLREATAADGCEVGGDASHQPVGRRRLVEKHLPVGLDFGSAAPQRLSREHPMEKEADSMNIRRRPDVTKRTVDLLGRHPGGRAEPGT